MRFMAGTFFDAIKRHMTAAGKTKQQKILIVCHSLDGFGMEAVNNLCVVIAQAKIGYEIMDLGNNGPWPGLDRYSAVLLCTEMLEEIRTETALELSRYVKDGGGLFVAFRGWHGVIADMAGVSPQDEVPAFCSPGAGGLTFVDELFPGTDGLRITDEHWQFEHCQLAIPDDDLARDCIVFVRGNQGEPIAWYREYGKGRVVFWNSVVLAGRIMRGFALQSLLLVMQVGSARILGAGMIQIDDFPPASSNQCASDAGPSFSNSTCDEFYAEAWLPDLMRLRTRHGLQYSCYAIINYHDIDTTGSSGTGQLGDMMETGDLANRLARFRNHLPDLEMGFHGYNHEPMTTDTWQDLSIVKRKLAQAREMWMQHLPGKMPVSYVPANNWYHKDHLNLIAQAFPEITSVCSLYSTGDPSMGEAREFGYEPWNEKLICLPRESCGYILGPKEKLMLLSQMAGMGSWTHFIHPDDVFDVVPDGEPGIHVRNPAKRFWRETTKAGQKGMLHEFEYWISFVTEQFPWFDFLTTSKLEKRCRDLVMDRVDTYQGQSMVKITAQSKGRYFIRLREDSHLRSTGSGKILDCRQVVGGKLYVVECRNGTTVFRF